MKLICHTYTDLFLCYVDYKQFCHVMGYEDAMATFLEFCEEHEVEVINTKPRHTKPRVELYDWARWPGGAFYGKVRNHPFRPDHDSIRTSRVVDTDGKTYAETLNTMYILCEPLE